MSRQSRKITNLRVPDTTLIFRIVLCPDLSFNKGSMGDRDQEFVEVSIEEFTSGKPAPFAIFIRLTSWKYLQITNPGDSLDLERLAAYKDKNVRCLYLTKADFSRHVGLLGAHPKPVAPLSGVAAK
ncbi:MAG: hypothetical protein HY074_04680, partial [Deltaproteobacteria bacterium]|nr:hypothetical protein [Deltaproteobacteria bacterium]